MQQFTKTKLKKTSFPLKVRFKDVLNHSCILSKHHLEIFLHYLNILRIQCKNVTIYFLLSPYVEIEDQILNAHLFMGGNSWSCRDIVYICVRLVPDSRFLNHIPNPNTNTNQH